MLFYKYYGALHLRNQIKLIRDRVTHRTKEIDNRRLMQRTSD